MKNVLILFLTISFAALAGCTPSQEQNTERTVLETDTVGVETEYQVEQQVQKVTVDTVTETQTLTREQDLDSTERSN